MKKFILILIPVIALLFFALFNLNGTKQSDKIKIAGSFAPIASIISEVSGENFEVISLIPPGVEPHDYEPLPAQQQYINDSSLIFYIGMDFDNWIADSTNDPLKIIDLSDSVTTKSGDPHYWLSYENAAEIAARIATELKMLAPQFSQDIDSNLLAFQLKLNDKLVSARNSISQLPHKAIITQHDAYEYLATELGLQIVGTIEETHGSEPSAAHLNELTKLVQQYSIKDIFAEPETRSDVVLTFAQDNSLDLRYLDAAGISTSNYLVMMDNNINSLITVLK